MLAPKWVKLPLSSQKYILNICRMCFLLHMTWIIHGVPGESQGSSESWYMPLPPHNGSVIHDKMGRLCTLNFVHYIFLGNVISYIVYMCVCMFLLCMYRCLESTLWICITHFMFDCVCNISSPPPSLLWSEIRLQPRNLTWLSTCVYKHCKIQNRLIFYSMHKEKWYRNLEYI